MTARAVFLDRDGTITDMVYYPEHGFVDSPCSPTQLVLLEGAGSALRRFHELGYELFVISNQPGVGKGHLTLETHQEMAQRLEELLVLEDVSLTGQYYCLHHPQAKLAKYHATCDCRKPKPGLLHQAAEEHDVCLEDSVTIGDGLTDVMAGESAGTKTILLTTLNSLVVRMIVDTGVEPTFIARNLLEAMAPVELISREGATSCRR